jgi:hypothetical protein
MDVLMIGGGDLSIRQYPLHRCVRKSMRRHADTTFGIRNACRII